jgi:2'-5' RNA ligase
LFEVLGPYRAKLGEPDFRWIDPRNYHVTLRFFGDLSRDQIGRAARAVAPVAAAASPLDCRIGALLPLPSARRPKVIALALDSAGTLERLAAAANAAFEPEFGVPDKPFKAHLTIVRCRRGARMRRATDPIGGTLHFDRVALFESSQAPTGVRYAVLEEFVLGERYSAS